MEFDRIKRSDLRMPHRNERQAATTWNFSLIVLRRPDRLMRKRRIADCNSGNSLSPHRLSAFSPQSSLSSIFFFARVSCVHSYVVVFFFSSPNGSGLMSFSYTVSLNPISLPPISAGLSSKSTDVTAGAFALLRDAQPCGTPHLFHFLFGSFFVGTLGGTGEAIDDSLPQIRLPRSPFRFDKLARLLIRVPRPGGIDKRTCYLQDARFEQASSFGL